jgi:hypothetical protein
MAFAETRDVTSLHLDTHDLVVGSASCSNAARSFRISLTSSWARKSWIILPFKERISLIGKNASNELRSRRQIHTPLKNLIRTDTNLTPTLFNQCID